MIKELKIYTIVCNICGADVNENSDYAGWTELDPTLDTAECDGWFIDKNDDNIHYCPKCHSFDDDDNLVLTKGANNERQM